MALRLYRKVCTVSPLAPGAEVISDSRITEQSQCKVGMRRAVAALTIRNRFFVGRNPLRIVHRFQFASGLEEAPGVEVLCPFKVCRARNASAARRPSDLPAPFVV